MGGHFGAPHVHMNWWEVLLQQTINGLTRGAVFALIALGYTMVYGIIELINFAHGDVFMLGLFISLAWFAVALALTAGLASFLQGLAWQPVDQAYSPRLEATVDPWGWPPDPYADDDSPASAGMRPGGCKGKAHKPEHLGYPGRRVLVSRKWSNKTLSEHKQDRRTWVLEALGLDHDQPTDPHRYTWRPVSSADPALAPLALRLLRSVAERQRWRNAMERLKAQAEGRPIQDPPDSGGIGKAA